MKLARLILCLLVLAPAWGQLAVRWQGGSFRFAPPAALPAHLSALEAPSFLVEDLSNQPFRVFMQVSDFQPTNLPGHNLFALPGLPLATTQSLESNGAQMEVVQIQAATDYGQPRVILWCPASDLSPQGGRRWLVALNPACFALNLPNNLRGGTYQARVTFSIEMGLFRP